MKHSITICLVMYALVVGGMTFPAYGEYLISTGVRYDTFSANDAPKTNGFEFTIPFGMAYRQKRYSISLETAYSNATVDSGDAPRAANLASLTDMLLSATYAYSFSSRPMGIIAGLDVNLPTGKERLGEQERIAEAGDRNDLFEVDNFGDGLNISLSLGLTREIENLSLGIQGAYIFKGEYDPTRDIPYDELNPGDQFLLLTILGWKASARLMIDTFAAYSHFRADTIHGQKLFRKGANVVFGGNLRYDRGLAGATVSLQGTMPINNEAIFMEQLPAEFTMNSSSDFFGQIDLAYHPSARLTVNVSGEVRYAGASDFKFEIEQIQYSIGLPFEGKRIRYAVGSGIAYVLNEHISCNGSLKFFTLRRGPDILQEQDLTFQGMNLNMGLAYLF